LIYFTRIKKNKNKEENYPFEEEVKINKGEDNLPMEFHPDTFKISQCPLMNYCKLDPKLCLNYHSLSEKRRDLKIYKYNEKVCSNVYTQIWKDPRNCEKGDSCQYSHTLYEYLYHPTVFRKNICKYELKNEKCRYLLICPYKHNTDVVDIKNICCNTYTIQYFKNKINKIIESQAQTIIKLEKVLNYYKCLICKNELSGGHVVNINCGKHLICKLCNEGVKKECPLCAHIGDISQINLNL